MGSAVELLTILGHIYNNGRNGITRDVDKASGYFTRAANQGNASATALLELMYEEDEIPNGGGLYYSQMRGGGASPNPVDTDP